MSRAHGFIYRKTNSEVGEQQTYRLWTAVAHEDFTTALNVTVHVEEEEGEYRPQGGEGQHGIKVFPCAVKQTSKEEETDNTEPRSQPINTINQVHGIHHKYSGSHTQRYTKPCGDLCKSKQPVEVIHGDTGNCQTGGTKELHNELQLVTWV